jgi:hypothetical protein
VPIEIAVPTAGASSRAYYEQTRAAWRRTLRWPFFVAGIVILVLAAASTWLVPHHRELVFGWCAGLGTGALWTLWDTPPSFIENWREGAEGEERTERALATLEPLGWRFRHDLSDAYGNIDHVAIGPPGVFLLDSKSWSGSVIVQDGAVVQRRALSPRNTFRDSRLARRMRGASVGLRQRLRATTGLDRRVTAVVVIWGAFEQGLVIDDQVVYIAGERLAGWLMSQEERLDRRERNLLALALDSGLALSEPRPEDEPNTTRLPR